MRTPPTRPPFLGRGSELSALSDALDAAMTGHGRLVIISGEPGIGKTRLADELGRLAEDRGALVMWGRAWADAGAAPFWPWIQVLRGYLAAVEPEIAESQLGPFSREIGQLLPEAESRPGKATSSMSDASETARFRLFDSVARFLGVAGKHRPLVIVLDDLQAMDPASIQLLRFVAAQVDGIALLLVATYRDLGTTDEPAALDVAALRRQAASLSVSLKGLPTTAIRGLLEAETGSRPDRALVLTLAEATAGNALFVNETIRLLATDGRLDQSAFGSRDQHLVIPVSIQAVIRDRLRHLPQVTIDALRLAAAIGPEFDARLLSRVIAARGATAAGIADSGPFETLDPAIRAGLVHDLGTGSFRFTHDLVRQSVYRDLSPATRFELHAAIAAAIESEPSSIESRLAELAFHFGQAELASHYGLAAPRIDPAIVIEYAVRAARRARSTLAFEDAARFDRAALRVLDDHPDAAAPSRLELLLDLGDAEARAGDLPAARRTFLEASALARDARAGRELAQAALGYGGRFIWSRAGDDPDVVRLLGDALRLLEESGADDQLLVRVRARLACAWRSDMAHREDSDRLSARALELARTLDDPATLTFALAGRFWATYWPENPTERLAIADELLAVARDAADVERIFDGHQARCAALLDLGRIAEARAEVVAARTAAAASRQPPQMVGIEAYEVVLSLLTGRFAEAEAEIEASGTESVVNAIRDDLSTATLHRYLLRRERGDPAELEGAIRSAVEAFPWYPYFQGALVCLLLDLGRTEEARLRFEQLAANSFATIYPDAEWFLGMALSAEACSELGDVPAAATLYDTLRPYSGRHAIAHAEGSMGAVDRYLGLLAVVLGHAEQADRHFADAVTANIRLESPVWTAHTQADWAEAILRSGAKDAVERASRLLDAATEVAERHEMSGLMKKLEAVRATHARVLRASPSAGEDLLGTPVADGSRAGAASLGVFRREGEYWVLRFDGTSCQLKDSKGMRYLAQLLADPGREFHVLDLVAALRDGGPTRPGPVQPGARATDGLSVGVGDSGELLDAEARRAYRERLAEIEADLREAQDWNDPERAALLVEERTALVAELAAAVGLGGRSRLANSTSERARLSVAKAIRSTLRRIEAGCAPLGRHLALAVRTGTYCTYAPDPGLRLTWDLGQGLHLDPPTPDKQRVQRLGRGRR